MRLARNLLLAATAAIAALAFMATSAFGQSVEVLVEDGAHCGNVVEEAAHNTSGGCEITAASTVNAVTFTHVVGPPMVETPTSSCENEFTANIDEDGTGYIDTTDTTTHINPPPTGTCVITACEEREGLANAHSEIEWPISGMFEYGAERERMVVTFCVRPINVTEGVPAGSTCTILIDINQNKTTHVSTFSANEAPCQENPASELSGTWQTTGASEVEIVHAHYPGDFTNP